MPPKGKHPEALKKQAQVRKPEDKQVDFVGSLINEVRSAETDRGNWEQNLDRWYRKRYGIRPARKTFPWPGAANYHIALTDEKIRKLKPNYLNLTFEGDPIVTMYPVGNTPLQNAADAEIFMDWLLKFYMNVIPGKNYFESITLIIDWMLEKGFSIGKVIWEYVDRSFTKVIDLEDLDPGIKEVVFNPETTDEDLAELLATQTGMSTDEPSQKKRIDKAVQLFRDGKTLIPILIDEVVYQGPRVISVDPLDLIVPEDTTDVEQARFICHRMHITLNDLRVGERSGKYKNIDDIADFKPRTANLPRQTVRLSKASREGVGLFLQQSQLIEIWEIFTWFDVDGDGVEEKVVVTVHPESETILRFIEFPYEHGRWPFVYFPYELNDDRWHSPRGVPAILDHYQTIVTNQENAKQNYMTLANNIQFKYRIGSVNFSQGRFIPGQGLGVHRMEDIEQLQVSRLDLSFDNEMVKIRQLAEQLIGQPDFTLGSMQQPQDRRTAFEVSEIVSLGKQVFSLDARVFRNSLQKLYDQIFDLWNQYGPEEFYIAVTGRPQVKLTKDQIRGNFVMVPNGEFTLLSRTLEEQRAFSILELAVSDQSGATDAYNAWENYLLKVDPRASKRILRKREDFEKVQEAKLQFEREQQEKKLEAAGRKSPTPSATGAPGSGGRLGQ